MDQLVLDSAFDPASRFDEWLQSLETFRNRERVDSALGVYLEGADSEFAEVLSLDNCLPHSVSSDGTLVVTEHGKLLADVEVATAIIDGLFKGKIKATEHVILEGHALVIGEISTPALTIRGGAIIEGRCYFEGPEQAPPEPWEHSGWQAFKVGVARIWRGRTLQ